MAQNIGKRRGKSPIKTRLKMERRAENKNPGSRKAFAKGLGTAASFVIPGGIATKATPIVRKAIEKTITKVQAKRNAKKMMAEIDMDPAIRNFDKAVVDGVKKAKKRSKDAIKMFKEDKSYAKAKLKRNKTYSKEMPKSAFFKAEKEKSKKNLKKAAKTLNEERAYMFKRHTLPEIKKVVKKAVGPVAGVSAAAATYKSKNRGGLTNTVPPKRGPKPQGYRKGADVDFYMGGDQNYSYGGGDLSYTFKKKKVDFKPSKDKEKAFDYDIKTFKVKPYVSASGYKPYKKSIKAQVDRFGLDTEYNSKKFNLKTRYSQNASGNKNKQFNADLSYRPNNKISVDLNTDARKSHSARAEFTPTNKTKFNINTDFDKDHDFGFEYKRKNTKLNVKSDANKNHSISAFYRKNNKSAEASYSSRKGLYGKVNVSFKHGGAAGCPHREIGVKSNIKGISGIQLKGQKFIGNK